ncbi:methyltransferase-like protein 27 isoform X1 [Plectropomus leopardus]|uniref:methyltransferase-like protein 27 isoform X1 n=2 Tax=Plectropomus leopardus TaxID=160734 RepID=UPI001C4AC50E|nr:methyltransferase-like protein 27 isoform X1 [Plectropomus leopardus]
MSDGSRTVDDVKALHQTLEGFDSQLTSKFYDTWAETYNQDMKLMNYRSPNLAVNILDANFSGNREEARVLDVACGSGQVAKLMVELGFRDFTGVDGSKGMLELAAKTGLYRELKLALLGPEQLPAQTDMFDAVIIAGAMDVGFAPVSVVRELCAAAKPGGFICISRGDHTATSSIQYKKELERELQLMEDEGLWTQVGINETDKYMENPHLSIERAEELQQKGRYISGKVYLYKKSINSNQK